MSAPHTDDRHAQTPVLRVTRYDLVSSFMIAAVTGLVLAVVWLVIVWLTNRIPELDPDPIVDIIEYPGGDPFGAENEDLLLESPEEIREDPAVEQADIDEQEVEQVFENVIELSEVATMQVQEVMQTGLSNEGEPGSHEGTGRRRLGDGPGSGGFGREQRWYVRFSDRGTLDLYARQLDFFTIELGVLLPGKKLVYMSNMAQATPTTRTVNTGKDEARLYMTWQSNGRREADLQLFQKAGIDASRGVIYHFYPHKTEQLLARLELDYRKRPVSDIRRTYFVVQPAGANDFQFVVTQQKYFR